MLTTGTIGGIIGMRNAMAPAKVLSMTPSMQMALFGRVVNRTVVR
jgi:hypothetical protein